MCKTKLNEIYNDVFYSPEKDITEIVGKFNNCNPKNKFDYKMEKLIEETSLLPDNYLKIKEQYANNIPK